jgi:tetraacyldisaccharide 4'-kinase
MTSAEIVFDDSLPVLMTEKDAVKCREFASDKLWYLSVDAKLPDVFLTNFRLALEQLRDQTL